MYFARTTEIRCNKATINAPNYGIWHIDYTGIKTSLCVWSREINPKNISNNAFRGITRVNKPWDNIFNTLLISNPIKIASLVLYITPKRIVKICFEAMKVWLVLLLLLFFFFLPFLFSRFQDQNSQSTNMTIFGLIFWNWKKQKVALTLHLTIKTWLDFPSFKSIHLFHWKTVAAFFLFTFNRIVIY